VDPRGPFRCVKTLYRQQGGKFPDPLLAIDARLRRHEEADARRDRTRGERQGLNTGLQMTSFANLKADGTTASGDWIYVGSLHRRRQSHEGRMGIQDRPRNDPTGMGFYPTWAWSWPANRRVLYNPCLRRSGRKALTRAPGIQWNGRPGSGSARLWSGDRSEVSDRVPPVYHEREGAAALLAFDERRTHPGTTSRSKNADPKPAPPEPVGGSVAFLTTRPGEAEPVSGKGDSIRTSRRATGPHGARCIT